MNKSVINRALTPRRIALCIVILLSAASYFNILSNGFVFDDESEILRNPWVKDIRFVPSIFLSHSWAFKVSDTTTSHYHPLKFIINMLLYKLFGNNPWGYHLTSIIVHVVVALMVFFVAEFFLKKVFNDNAAIFPAAAASLFAVHPVHSEAVAWIAAMPELFMSFFYLLSFLVYIRASGLDSGKFIIAAICFLGALLFKETALTLLLVLIAYDYFFKEGIFEKSGSVIARYNLLKRYVPFIIIAIVYLSLRTYAVHGFVPQKSFAAYASSEIIINAIPLLSEYISMLLFPVRLSAVHVFHPLSSLFDERMLPALLIAVLFVSAIMFTRKKNIAFSFGLLWTVIPLLPVFYLPAFIGESVFSERYLYLPSAGFVIALMVLSKNIFSKKLFGYTTSSVLLLCVIAVSVIFMSETVKRNPVWRDNYSLWSDTLRKSPDSYVSRINMGKEYYSKGMAREAILEYRTAQKLNPADETALFNIGTVYYEIGMMDDAIEVFQAALRLKPDSYRIHNNLGDAYYKKGLLDNSIKEYKIALSLKPDYNEAQHNLFMLYSIKKMLDSKQK